jgi:hypothetical protein
VLEICDENEPVVDPKVRDEVDQHHLGERPLVRPVSEDREVERDTEVGCNDLCSVLGLEQDRVRVEIYNESVMTKVDNKRSGLRLVPLG